MSRVSSRTFLVFALAAVSVVLLILSSSNRLAPVEGALSSAGRPFLITFSGIGRQINNMITTARDLATLRGRNNQLQTMVDTLTIDNLRLQEAESENERLRSLLRFRQLNPNYDFRGGQVIARVIGKTPSNYLQSITIDLGSEHGIKPGMPVVTERGLVGRIHKVGALSSTVLLITDPSSGVPALIRGNRLSGVVGGDPLDGRDDDVPGLLLRFVPGLALDRSGQPHRVVLRLGADRIEELGLGLVGRHRRNLLEGRDLLGARLRDLLP